MNRKVILATKSPYLISIFDTLGIPFKSVKSEVIGYRDSLPNNPDEFVFHCAKIKAEAVAAKHSEGIIIGISSVAWHNGALLEKPKSKEAAVERLKILSGRNCKFFTGVYLKDLTSKRVLFRCAITHMKMRAYSTREVSRCMEQDPNFCKYTLGFDPLRSYGGTFVKEIEGSFNNLRGMPLEIIIEMLKEVDYEIE